ncbi:MAG: glycoside hydrolase family 16 protein [Terriglobales bacterium]
MKRRFVGWLCIAFSSALLLGCARAKPHVAGSAPAAAAPRNEGKDSCRAWKDSFNTGQLDATRWMVANGRAPGYVPKQHIGYYEPDNVQLDGGMLTLTLTQARGAVDSNPSGVISHGALIHTKNPCGYGTYEWTMKMSSASTSPMDAGPAVSGSVSAGFLYINNSETEIDFEFSGDEPSTLWLVNWLNPAPLDPPTKSIKTYTAWTPFNPIDGFHHYKLVWSPGKISYYVDGVRIARHTTHVPSAPAHFMINHWGKNGATQGGAGTLGVVRYFYISKASYKPRR